jgi:radical SAM superfamily enzyme YgiQ (UPF0313 family)
MKIDLYQLSRGIHFSRLSYGLILDLLKVWAEAKGWQAHTRICEENKVLLSSDADVVGINVYTQTAPAAYRVSERFRRRGKIVILGGPHFRDLSTYEEASPYCDVLVSSICEEQWHNLLRDIEEERILPNRRTPLRIVDSKDRFRYPNDFFDSLRNRKWHQFPAVPTSIGCPYDCDFCSPYMKGKYVLRSVETIRNEAAYAKGKLMALSDATFGLNKEHTFELMEALAPLKKKILLGTILARLDDAAFLDALALGGVKWIVVGIETMGTQMRKHGTSDLVGQLRRVIDQAHDRGMMIHGNFICGLDNDGPESFEQFFEVSHRSGMDMIMVGILTPYPQTRLYQRMQKEGRIFDTNWEHYDGCHVVYQPLRMTVDQLMDGYLELYRNIIKRKSLFAEVYERYTQYGLGGETAVMVGSKLQQKYDLRKKRKMLRENRKQIPRPSPIRAQSPLEV